MRPKSVHRLEVDDLTLSEAEPITHDDGYRLAVYSDEFTLGDPAPVEVTMDSMMQDGSLVVKTRDDNREMTLLLAIEASDTYALAVAQRRVALALNDAKELRWTPFDGWGKTTVFDVLTAHMQWLSDDQAELLHLRRTFRLRFVCRPFGHSVTRETIAALSAAPVPATITISDGTSIAGWVNEQPESFGQLTASGGWLHLPSTSNVLSASAGWQLEKTSRATRTLAATDFSATPYVSVDVDGAHAGTLSTQIVNVLADGTPLALVNATSPNATTRRVTFLCPDSSVTKLTVEVFTRTNYPAGPRPIGGPQLITNVVRSNVPPKSSTARQLLRSLDVKGSVRTAVQLAVEHPTSGLGDVIVYTGGPQPDLRRWRRSLGTTAVVDASLVSGAYDSTANGVGFPFAIPSTTLKRGGYALVARVRAVGAGSDRALEWAVGAQGGVARLVLTGTWQIVTLGGVIAPDVDVLPASAAVTTGHIRSVSGAGEVHLDEAWLFYVGEGAALTIVSCGSGSPAPGSVHNRLWLMPADAERPEPSIWRGTKADMSDAIHAGPVTASWGDHRFMPPSTTIYTATTAVENPLVSGSYYPSDAFHAVD